MNTDEHTEEQNRKDCLRFIQKVKHARQMQKLPDLHHYDLGQYCQVLINGASLVWHTSIMECNDRIDLVIDPEEHLSYDVAKKFREFSKKYLGLDLDIQGDPRGAVFKLIVDPSLGDSFGDHCHLCVPQFEGIINLY